MHSTNNDRRTDLARTSMKFDNEVRLYFEMNIYIMTIGLHTR